MDADRDLARFRGELAEFVADVFASLPRRDQRRWGACYLRGLMDGRRKSIQPMAERARTAAADRATEAEAHKRAGGRDLRRLRSRASRLRRLSTALSRWPRPTTCGRVHPGRWPASRPFRQHTGRRPTLLSNGQGRTGSQARAAQTRAAMPVVRVGSTTGA
ncbi:transposase [Streptomyces koyangensis]